MLDRSLEGAELMVAARENNRRTPALYHEWTVWRRGTIVKVERRGTHSAVDVAWADGNGSSRVQLRLDSYRDRPSDEKAGTWVLSRERKSP